jgi:hypothetical protein
MAEMKILRSDGGAPISVSGDASKLEINEPVSVLTNLAEVIRSMSCLETLVFYVTDYGKVDSSISLSFLTGAKRLKGLSLRSMPHLQDCSAISECESLEWLDLSRHTAKVFDFSGLLPLNRLKRLSVEMPDNHALEAIAKLSQLTSLEARGGFKLKSLETLVTLVNLESLKLWSGSLFSTRGLSEFRKLKVLNLGHCKIKDTSDLGSIKGLIEMELVGNKSISDLNFLRESDLESLGLYEILKLNSIKPISRLPRLKELRSSASRADGDLLPLVEHPSLMRVVVAGRYKAALKKLKVDSACVFKAGHETFKISQNGPVVLQTAGEWKEMAIKKLAN